MFGLGCVCDSFYGRCIVSKIVKRIVTAVLAAVGLIVFVVGGYVIYLFVDYERAKRSTLEIGRRKRYMVAR